MNEEDEAFNEIERQAGQRKEAVRAQLTPLACERCKQLEEQAYDLLGRLQAANLSISLLNQTARLKKSNTINEVLQRIKELRPAVMPLESMGRGKATHEWFDILVKDIEEMKK